MLIILLTKNAFRVLRSLKDEPMILLSLSFQLITLVPLWNGLLDDLVLFFSLILQIIVIIKHILENKLGHKDCFQMSGIDAMILSFVRSVSKLLSPCCSKQFFKRR